jgi:hypothetical protein
MRAITLLSMVLMAIKPFAGELIFNLKLGADADSVIVPIS